MPDHANNRITDTWKYKVESLSSLLIAIGIISGALFVVIETRFETKADAAMCASDIRRDATDTKNQVIEMRKDIQYIREGISELRDRR
jgi:hypothetical protein